MVAPIVFQWAVKDAPKYVQPVLLFSALYNTKTHIKSKRIKYLERQFNWFIHLGWTPKDALDRINQRIVESGGCVLKVCCRRHFLYNQAINYNVPSPHPGSKTPVVKFTLLPDTEPSSSSSSSKSQASFL